MPQLSLTEADRTLISQEEARRIAHTVDSVTPVVNSIIQQNVANQAKKRKSIQQRHNMI